MSNQRLLKVIALFKSVGPEIGLPQIVLTVPFTLMPASVAFLMHRSASFQYSGKVQPELAK